MSEFEIKVTTVVFLLIAILSASLSVDIKAYSDQHPNNSKVRKAYLITIYLISGVIIGLCIYLNFIME